MEIFTIIKLASISGILLYVGFLHLSRKSLKMKIEKLESTIIEKDKRIAIITNQVELLRLNLTQIKEYASKDKEITESTNTVIKIINNNEVSDEDKDKAVADMLDKLSNSGLRNIP